MKAGTPLFLSGASRIGDIASPSVDKWCARIASEHGPSGATTRLVLLALAAHMDGGCNRNTHQQLAIQTAMSRSGVILHVRLAVRAGWLKQIRIRGNGRRGRAYQYEPLIPVNCSPERVVARGTSRETSTAEASV